ncbi:MAG: radical SAM protein [Candidatus Omnitrophota bacterium]
MPASYLKSFKSGKLKKITKKIYQELKSCAICPRKCRVNRLKNEMGFCRTGLKARIYSFMPHHGEEPPISGKMGSGTIFFSNCNMSCAYCQNFKFSQEGEGREVDDHELSSFMLELQEMGCLNINLVTPTHVLPQILNALLLAIPQGLKLPIVYNTAGYELLKIIRMLEGIVDIYLADMRYASEKKAKEYSLAPGYPKYNQQSLIEMHKQVGMAKFDLCGIIVHGLIIRHLVLPGRTSGTEQVMRFIADNISQETYISLMSQYSPYYKACKHQEINRRISLEEYAEAKKIMQECGLHNGWTQEEHGLENLAGIHIKSNFL